jgi:hypothetical protein
MIPRIRENFLDSDYTVPINTIAVDGSEFTSKHLALGLARYASMTFYVKGNHASCSKDITFIIVSFDSKRNQWDTEALMTVNLAANGESAVQKTINIAPDVEAVKLLSVQNQETVAGYTADVNVSVYPN